MASAELDVLGEARVIGEHGGAGVDAVATAAVLVDAQSGVDLIANRFLLGFGNAEHLADDPHRHVGAEIAHEVEPVAVPTSGIGGPARRTRGCAPRAQRRAAA